MVTLANYGIRILLSSTFIVTVLGDSILASSGFTNCIGDATVRVNYANITFNKDTGIVYFDASGTSAQEQKVEASLVVTAYGQQVFQKSFNPCDNATFVQQLCPVPKGNFAASGSQKIPSDYLSKVPAIAFSVPDIDADAQLELRSLDTGKEVACVKSGVTNGKSIEVPAVSAVSGIILGVSLLLAGIGAVANAGTAGTTSPSPSFGAVLGWFQSMAMNGMLSVNYPPIYRSFTKNFGFSAGILSWDTMQVTIDNFRASTGGNLTDDSVRSLRNSSLLFTDGEHNQTTFRRRDPLARRISLMQLASRDLSTSVNGTGADPANSRTQHLVSGVKAYVEMLSIPQANTFMTVLMVFAMLVAAIIVSVLGFKLILEFWALFASFPKRLTGFRKRYWRTLANTIATLILLLYGIWTIWCIFQWTNGDSWAAKALAAVTWAVFTAILLFYTVKVFVAVQTHKRQDGDTSALYEDNETWHKYGFMYDSYRKGYWWIFVPIIIYMFAKGVTIAAGKGHGIYQTGAQLIIESLMLIFLLWTRPFASKGANWINNTIAVVRVLSIVCILVFVEQLGIAQTTKTITGVVLIAVQCGLTGVLAILLVANAIRVCIKTNPHVKRREEERKRREQLEKGEVPYEAGFAEPRTPLLRDISPIGGNSLAETKESSVHLVNGAADMGYRSGYGGIQAHGDVLEEQSASSFDGRMNRQPTVPNIEMGTGGRPPYRVSRRPAFPVMRS